MYFFQEAEKLFKLHSFTHFYIYRQEFFFHDNKDQFMYQKRQSRYKILLDFFPHHLINNTCVRLDDLDDFIGHVLVRIIRDGDAKVVVFIHFNSCINSLQKAFFVDAGEDEACFIECLGAFGAGAYADCREGMTDTCEEAALLGQCSAVGNDRKGVHLQAVIVVESQRFVLNDTLVELKAALLQALF